MKDFFISYTKADKAWAEWIAWMLEKAGYSVTIQAWDFQPGGNFVLEMQRAASETDKTIAVLSPDYLQAAYTEPEWATAFAKDPQGKNRKLIPVRVSECKPIGMLAPLIYVDLVGLPEEDARAALLGAFSERAKPQSAPAFPGGPTPRVAPVQPPYPGAANAASQSVVPTLLASAESAGHEPLRPRLSAVERLQFAQQLNATPPQHFSILVFAVDPPTDLIPPMPAPQGDRAAALLGWAEGPGGCGLSILRDLLNEITNPPGPPPPPRPPKTLVVDPHGHGLDTYSTVTSALQAAEPGDTILVRPGSYQESVIINKQVEIIGEGTRDKVMIKATGTHTVSFRAAEGRIANLTLRQTGGGEWYCVDIAGGHLKLEGCDITGDGQGGIAIHEQADPKLIKNHIHDCKNGGVDLYERGQGTLEGNHIYGNGLAGVAIRGDANPTLQRNRIYGGEQEGVWAADHGQGTLEDNDIYGNGLAGVAIHGEANPTLRRNRIHHGKQEGVWVGDHGQGTLEENDIFGNRVAGVAILKGGNPTLRRNRIYDGQQEGVWVGDDGKGTLEGNYIYGNGLAGVAIWRGGNPTLRGNHIYNGRKEGVFVREGGRGVFSGDNNVHGNEGRDWDISEDCKDKVKWV